MDARVPTQDEAVIAPDSIETFQSRLVAITDGLPKRLRQCADYIAANTDRIAVSTVAELSAGAGVPPSAFMRFCQMMGFSGFSEMQRLFRDSYAPVRPDYATRLRSLREEGPGSASVLLAEFVEAGRQSLEILAQKTDARALDEAVGLLAQAGPIHIASFRRAVPVAGYLAYASEKMGIPAMLHEGTGKLDHSHALRVGDALIAITFAPYSTETIALAETAVERALPVVGVTDTSISPVAPLSTALLAVPEVDFGAFRSLSATLALEITLAVAVGAQRQPANG